jgi:diaminopimelate epimerase
MTKLQLAKLHATGNDFLVRVALEPGAPELDADTARFLCDRHRGIGADGCITIGPSGNGADCTMTLRNADGSPAEMSGNGIRCLAWVAARAGLGGEDSLDVDTAAGRRAVTLMRSPSGDVIAADVDMGAVTVERTDATITVHGVDYTGDIANIGNPHFVTFVDDPGTVRVASHGAIIERNELFPNGVNVEFVRADSRTSLTMRVWERGAGETLSCGTGACAAAAVANRRGLVDQQVEMHVPGGVLRIGLGDTVRLGGPVVHIFDVDIEIA